MDVIFFIDTVFDKSTSMILFYLNIISYVLTIICFFWTLFLIDVSFLKTIRDFKGLLQIPFMAFSIILAILSCAGMPPLLGFFGKFLIFTAILNKTSNLLLILFLLFNSFGIYFYIQNMKALIKKNELTIFLSKDCNFHLNFNLVYNIIVLCGFISFGFFFLSDFFIMIHAM